MPHRESFWFKVGYAVGRVRSQPPPPSKPLRGLRERLAEAHSHAEERSLRQSAPRASGAEDPVGTALRTLGIQMAARMADSRAFARGSTWWAAAAGAGVEVGRAALHAGLARAANRTVPALGTGGRLAHGAATGLVYASWIRPLIPGGWLVRGAVLGGVGFLTSGVGGLPRLLGAAAPHRQHALLAHLLDAPGVDPAESLWEHLLTGLALAALYESRPLRSGTTGERGS